MPNMTSVDIAGTPYSLSLEQVPELQALSERVEKMRDVGSLSPQVLGRLRTHFRIRNIYNSNAIEGNALDVGETRLVVEAGLTISGKPLKDQAEAKNLSEALDFLEELATGYQEPLTERDVRQIHDLVLKGIDDDNAGRYRSVAVEISGSAFSPPSPESIPAAMRDFGEWLATASVDPANVVSLNGLLASVAAHTWFVTVHPFIDGNGRVARLLLNLMLMRFGFPVAIVSKEDRARYYDALEDSQSSDISGFAALVGECIEESLEDYEAAAAEQRLNQEWAQSIAGKFTAAERARTANEYEVWKSAMELMRSYFRQTAGLLDEADPLGDVYFKDFGHLEFEKYVALRSKKSAKRTWFFRVDLRSGGRAARYLFFFGSPSYWIQRQVAVSIFVAREESPYYYERLENISAPNCPGLLEIGYEPDQEQFIARYRGNTIASGKIENIGRQFLEEVIKMHFGG